MGVSLVKKLGKLCGRESGITIAYKTTFKVFDDFCTKGAQLPLLWQQWRFNIADILALKYSNLNRKRHR
jgi:hypothetical protein